MCSFNRINNSYGCQNSKTLNGILKTELGFQGFVVTDYLAQQAGYAAANAGLDSELSSSLVTLSLGLTHRTVSMPLYPFVGFHIIRIEPESADKVHRVTTI